MRRLVLLFLIGLMTGCAHFEIGIEQPATPTSQPAAATQHAIIATPTIEPTPTPTLPPPTSTATELPATRSTSTPIGPANPIGPLPTPAPTLPLSQISRFTVEPLEVNPGEAVTLRWETTDAEDVSLAQYLPDNVPYSETVHLASNGEISQTILGQERQWHVFELAAANAAGVVTQKVKVSIRCPDTYFFSPLPEADRERWDCPDGPAITSSAAEQAFENGRMIWQQHDDRIYVFFTDGTYRTYENTWAASQPDTVPGLTPPQGRVAPVRGFGKVWSGEAEVRAQLGWALAPEQGFETRLQGGWIHCCSELAAVNRPVYVRGLDGRIVRLWAGEVPPGQWSVFTP
jgi:hypothetical protein